MDKFLEEYSSEAAIRKYSKETAGEGISRLLESEYGQIYTEVLEKYLPAAAKKSGVRLMEFGCGGGMNLIHLVGMLEKKGVRVASAYGTDFSPKLIAAAKEQAARYLPKEQQGKVQFCEARHETLIEDLTKKTGQPKSSFLGSFDLIVGVNTFRYCYRAKKEVECAQSISDLLAKGGVCVNIDMNDKFPFFRSKLKDKMTKSPEEYYLPSLAEYGRPFAAVGLKILRQENFCWVPHSAGPALLTVCKMLTPVLNTVARKRAMRSLIIAQKN